MKTIKISIDLHNFFVSSTRRDNFNASLYLVGKNAAGIYVDKKPLRRTGGCEYMPSTSTSNITRAYVSLLKQKLTPNVFVLVAHNTLYRTEWGEDFGSAIDAFGKEVVFITYGRDFLKAESVARELKVQVVNSNYKITK
jgi:hypothetical protein